MGSPLIGSSKSILDVTTDLIYLSFKASTQNQRQIKADFSAVSITKIKCISNFACSILESTDAPKCSVSNGFYQTSISEQPLFFEQQNYLLNVESSNGHEISFWHDNLNIRQRINRIGKINNTIGGIVNFGNDIGYSDFVIFVDGREYLRITIEVFPSKISYKEDYQNILNDVTSEIYSIAFDILKRTYQGYKQKDSKTPSPIEFLSILKSIYVNYIKSVDMIIKHPHHVLETTHPITRADRIKRVDKRTIRWIEKHPEQTNQTLTGFQPNFAPAVNKRVTYNTKENRMVKTILLSTIQKLELFRARYVSLQRDKDEVFIHQIDTMIYGINQRIVSSFLNDIEPLNGNTELTLVMTMAVGYRDLYKYHIMLKRGLSITGDIFNISLKDLSVLYEYWCFIKINQILRNEYRLMSQDIVRSHNNGLFVTLVKGRSSRIHYKTKWDESIYLSYNPKFLDIPTSSQQPDNILSLQKLGASYNYEYVFDAKYRINPAEVNSDYYNFISKTPGPEVDDINTMHRYRDAIVLTKNAPLYERSLFGAYVLFPYHDEEEYKDHRFYRSIEAVNIGGLPFLPNSTTLVSTFLNLLISETSLSANHRIIGHKI
jgi:predicted component of viral defense system (DUF524 family)